MHDLVLVLLPTDGIEDFDGPEMQARLDTAMAPFDENLDVSPWREYLTGWDLRNMPEQYGTEPGDLEALLPHLKAWCGYPGGINALGLYKVTTRNPLGKWDWYQVGGRWSGRFTALHLPYKEGCAGLVADLPAFTRPCDLEGTPPTIGARAVVYLAKPEAYPAWIALQNYDPEREPYFFDEPDYLPRVTDLLARSRGHLGVFVDIHH